MDGFYAERSATDKPKPRPHHSQPGTFGAQMAAIDLFLDDPDPDRKAAWLRARAVSMEHAAPAYLVYRGRAAA